MEEVSAQLHDEKIQTLGSGFHITTALLWRTSGELPALSQVSSLDAHVLNLHCQRVVAAARAFRWTAVVEDFQGPAGHERFEAILCRRIPDNIRQSQSNSNTWKVRLLVSEDGNLEVLSAPIALHAIDGIPVWPSLPEQLHSALLSSEVCNVFVDKQPTQRFLFTAHKTTVRGHYDEARSRSNIEHCAPTESEVLLFNEEQEVMEASLCTPYFQRGGKWITPTLSSGGNAGVSRRMALEAGLCTERRLHVDELVSGETVWLSNAVRGFIQGKLQFSEGTQYSLSG